MKTLRARAFAAIAIAVAVSIVVTLVVAAVLVRASSRSETLKGLARQAELFAVQQQQAPTTSAGGRSLGVFLDTQQERLTIISLDQAGLLLPLGAAADIRAGRPAQGSLAVGGRQYFYAARRSGTRVVVLLRAATLAASDWRPFTVAFGIAAVVGAGLAAIFGLLLAGTVVRPIRRVVEASLRLAAGERHDPLPLGGPTEVRSLSAAFNQMEEELARAQDAERSFLLSVSHELKTPLASIRGHGEALLDGVLDVPRAAPVIVQEAGRLERLVRDLLDLARLRQDAFAVAASPVDLVQIARDAAARHDAAAQRTSVSLVVSGAHSRATADPDRLLQVVSNLIENAVRSTPAGGTVTVTAAPGRIEVEDTGPGLSAEDVERAFERFYLYDRYRGTRSVGNGLGLSIVRELTEAMGGCVSVDSRVGEGTRFVVELPAAAAGGA